MVMSETGFPITSHHFTVNQSLIPSFLNHTDREEKERRRTSFDEESVSLDGDKTVHEIMNLLTTGSGLTEPKSLTYQTG